MQTESVPDALFGWLDTEAPLNVADGECLSAVVFAGGRLAASAFGRIGKRQAQSRARGWANKHEDPAEVLGAYVVLRLGDSLQVYEAARYDEERGLWSNVSGCYKRDPVYTHWAPLRRRPRRFEAPVLLRPSSLAERAFA